MGGNTSHGSIKESKQSEERVNDCKETMIRYKNDVHDSDEDFMSLSADETSGRLKQEEAKSQRKSIHFLDHVLGR